MADHENLFYSLFERGDRHLQDGFNWLKKHNCARLSLVPKCNYIACAILNHVFSKKLK